MAGDSAAKFKFNNFQEIKSHSSVLYNERMAILFYLLDMKNLVMHKTKTIEAIYDVHSVIRQIYKNVRMLLRFNDTVRITMNLETKDPGIYTIDVAMGTIDKLIKYCEMNDFTLKRMDIIMQELDNAELLLKDIMQYFHYFIRPDFKQKPDVDAATEKYKEMADTQTIEQLRGIAGMSNMVDFESLGSERVEPETESIDFDPTVDGDISEYSDDNDTMIGFDDDDDDDEIVDDTYDDAIDDYDDD